MYYPYGLIEDNDDSEFEFLHTIDQKGDPKPTAHLTTEQMSKMGVIGVYTTKK